MRRIAFLNLQRLHEECRDSLANALQGVLSRGIFVRGPRGEAFEEKFARWLGGDYHVVGCGNGTDAITLAATALGLPPGSEAVLPAMTYVGTAEGLRNAGLSLRLVDIRPDTWVMDPELLEKAITPRTKLIVPVHLYGQMAAMDAVRAVADRHGCRILEDAAQAHGARWKDKPVGWWGDVATFSFYPGKNLGALGDAGAVASRDRDLLQKARRLGNHGGDKKYEHLVSGFNSRLDEMQAAVLEVKLSLVDKWNAARRRIADRYRSGLEDLAGLVLPTEAPDAHAVWHLYVVKAPAALAKKLEEKGIETGRHYPLPIHRLPAFAGEAFTRGAFPHAESLAENGLSLPICPTLTDDEVEYVVSTIRRSFVNGL